MAILNTDINTIQSRAPTRIDLAGGTLDIWPIYLFLDNPVTLNLAIDLYAEATISVSKSASAWDSQVSLKSVDQKLDLKLSWKEFTHNFRPPPALELHYKLLKFFFEKRRTAGWDIPDHDFSLTTQARSPAGAGLGGSSALSVAMTGALARWAALESQAQGHPQGIDLHKNGEDFIEIIRDVETTVIHVPAGLQDYYGAMFGGLQCLKWGTGIHQRSSHPADLIPELQERLLLFYSGQSRNSGINNWALFKDFIDGQSEVRARFSKITIAAQKLQTALANRQWGDVGIAIAEEWETRKSLATGISTPEIDQAFAEARALGPLSGKVCGAGGGGCFFVYFPQENKKELSSLRASVQEIFVRHGMTPLAFHGVSSGLEVRTS